MKPHQESAFSRTCNVVLFPTVVRQFDFQPGSSSSTREAWEPWRLAICKESIQMLISLDPGKSRSIFGLDQMIFISNHQIIIIIFLTISLNFFLSGPNYLSNDFTQASFPLVWGEQICCDRERLEATRFLDLFSYFFFFHIWLISRSFKMFIISDNWRLEAIRDLEGAT